MHTTITPMSLGDIFDRLFKLLSKTAFRNLIIAVIVMLPAAIIFTNAMDAFFSNVGAVSRADEASEPIAAEDLAGMAGSTAVYLIGIFLFTMSTFAATLGVTLIGCHEMNDEQIDWNEALRQTFSLRLLRVFGQIILQVILIGSLVGLPYFILMGGVVAKSIATAVLGGVLFAVGLAAGTVIWVRWAFAVPAIAWEDATVLESLRTSWDLVRGREWRTFAILVLLNLVVQFALSIVTTPISLFAFRDFYTNYYEVIGSAATGEPSIEMLEAFDSFGNGFGILISFSSILALTITPLISTVMYFDLRARSEAADEANPMPVEPA